MRSFTFSPISVSTSGARHQRASIRILLRRGSTVGNHGTPPRACRPRLHQRHYGPTRVFSRTPTLSVHAAGSHVSAGRSSACSRTRRAPPSSLPAPRVLPVQRRSAFRGARRPRRVGVASAFDAERSAFGVPRRWTLSVQRSAFSAPRSCCQPLIPSRVERHQERPGGLVAGAPRGPSRRATISSAAPRRGVHDPLITSG